MAVAQAGLLGHGHGYSSQHSSVVHHDHYPSHEVHAAPVEHYAAPIIAHVAPEYEHAHEAHDYYVSTNVLALLFLLDTIELSCNYC